MDGGAPQEHDYSGKIVLTVPSALMWLFAYTQHVENRQHIQAFPPISPVSGAVPKMGITG